MRFFVDDDLVKIVSQSPSYPMQLKLSISAFGRRTSDRPSSPFVVERFRCYAPVDILAPT